MDWSLGGQARFNGFIPFTLLLFCSLSFFFPFFPKNCSLFLSIGPLSPLHFESNRVKGVCLGDFVLLESFCFILVSLKENKNVVSL